MSDLKILSAPQQPSVNQEIISGDNLRSKYLLTRRNVCRVNSGVEQTATGKEFHTVVPIFNILFKHPVSKSVALLKCLLLVAAPPQARGRYGQAVLFTLPL